MAIYESMVLDLGSGDVFEFGSLPKGKITQSQLLAVRDIVKGAIAEAEKANWEANVAILRAQLAALEAKKP